VKRILDELLPRIQRGDFSDLGDHSTHLDVDDRRFEFIRPEDFAKVRARWDRDYYIEIDPGICLLGRAIRELPMCRDLHLARMVACASKYAATLGYEDYDGLGIGGADWDHLAWRCLAWDLRDAYRRWTRRTRAAKRADEEPNNVVQLFLRAQ